MDAIKQAADAGKYLFVFFLKTEDEQTLAMRKVFDQAMKKASDRGSVGRGEHHRHLGKGHCGEV